VKVLGFALPKAVGIALSSVLGAVVVATGVVAAVPQARVALAPIARHVPAIGPAAGQTYRIEGPSMEPAYHSGDYVTLLPLTAGRPQVCDAVAYRATPDSVYVKRVVAIGPATVLWTQGSVEVKGQTGPVCPAYVHGGDTGAAGQPQSVPVPPGYYFVVGDNLLDSTDSRQMGSITHDSIVGYLPG
jgi:signal peptidase I